VCRRRLSHTYAHAVQLTSHDGRTHTRGRAPRIIAPSVTTTAAAAVLRLRLQLLLYSTSRRHSLAGNDHQRASAAAAHLRRQSARPNIMTSPSAAASSARCYVPRSVIVAVAAALASCTDAATVMTRMKGETRFSIIVFRPSASYLNTCPSVRHDW